MTNKHKNLPRAAALIGAWLCAHHASAAYISELFQAGPAGQAIEITAIDPAQGATLAILNGSRFDANGFGQILQLIELAPDPAMPLALLITDQPWPDATVLATPLAQIAGVAGPATLALGGNFHDRLLILLEGHSDLAIGDNPITDTSALADYDADAVHDWLSIGPSGQSAAYSAAGYGIGHINDVLGIDLLSHTADRAAGTVVARAAMPGQTLDLETIWVGTPDSEGRIALSDDLSYRVTPGNVNVPLVSLVPEPGSAAGVLVGGLMLARRRRTKRCYGGPSCL